MSENIQEYFWLLGYPDAISRFDPTVAQAFQNLVLDLLPIKKPIRKSQDTHVLLVQAVEKHLDMLLPVQEAVKNWLALYNHQKPEYRLSRELSDYGGSPRSMSQWLDDSSDSRVLHDLIDLLIYVENDLDAALNEKKTKQVLKKTSGPVSCYFCWRGVDPPRQYCSNHSQVEHPAVYTRFQSHLKRLGVWVKRSDRKNLDYAIPYYCRSGPGLLGGRIRIQRPVEFHWTDPAASSVIREKMPKSAMRMDETHCWESLRKGWPNFVEKTLAAFESESQEERDLLIDHPETSEGVLWGILERYELWTRWWGEHPFPGRGRERSRHAKVHEHQVQRFLGEGLSKTEIARRTGLSRQAVYKIIERIKTALPVKDRKD